MSTIEYTLGSDKKILFLLKLDGKAEPLDLNLPGGDSIKVLFPGQTVTLVKTLDNVIATEVVIDNNDRGEFHAQLIETDLLKPGLGQPILVKIKRGTEDIVMEFLMILNVTDPILKEPV
ncbi:MAG: hypothetical protein V3R67_03465 [Thermodesulfobacteriota bacterium]